MSIDYIRTEKTTMTISRGNREYKTELLWGDQVKVLEVNGDRAQVIGRGKRGEIATEALGGSPLLKFYFIDVGQGDGVFIVTPSRKHLLIG